jgi:hypothetical protein
MDYGPEIDAALSTQDSIPRDKVLLWIESAGDLPTLAKLYRLTGEGYYRIQPELGKKAACRAVQRYLLECIRQDVTDKKEEIESRWEAAATLHFWLRHLLEKGDSSDVITGAAKAITDLFLTNEEARDAIETGFLEHALETSALRPYFEYWSRDERLREAWERALEWGKAHPDYMWDLFVNHKHRGVPL